MSAKTRAGSSSGFTVVELLVVIAIIGTLVSILIPAVGSARVAAARAQNLNNLKQIGTAINTYESTNGTYPPLVKFPQGVQQTAENMNRTVSWAFEILPHLEQRNAFEAFDRTQPVSATANYVAMTVTVPVYLNPQRPTRTRPDAGAFVNGYAWSNDSSYPLPPSVLDYSANGGVLVDSTNPTQPVMLSRSDVSYNQALYTTRFNQRYGGPFHFGVQVPQAAVKDGVSNTIAVGDRWVGPAIPASSGIAMNDLGGLAGQSLPTTVRYANPDDRSTAGGLNSSFPSDKTDPSIYKFGGIDGRDCCFVFLDGSARWVPFDIEQQVYQFMASINDGGVIPAFE